MSVWFEGSAGIQTTIGAVTTSFENLGEHYVGIVKLMPGMTTVELIDQGDDFVTIKTNEGTMKRTNITVQAEAQRVAVEFDEVYEAGSVTGTSHYMDEFSPGGEGVLHHTVISNVEMPGVLGFFYRKFGSKNIGTAVLNAYKEYLEN